MKRILSVGLCILMMLTAFAGCGTKKTGATFYAQLQEEANGYTVITETLMRDGADPASIVIHYPIFAHEKRDCTAVNEKVQNVIEEFVASWVPDAVMDVDFEVKFLNNHYASIVFTGFADGISAAHPVNIAFSLNFNMDQGKSITLSDFVSIDDDLVQTFRKELKEQTIPEIAGYYDSYSDEQLSDELKNEDSTDGYFTKDSVGILVTVPHAIGDYLDIVIPIQE